MERSDMPQDFTEEQKQYLEGFVSGCNLARTARGLPTFAGTVAALGIPPGVNPGPGAPDRDARDAEPPAGPDARMCQAQDRFLAEGKKLAPEELAKRKRHPLDIWDDLRQHAREGRFPRGTDVLAFKYHGLFYVAPAQDAYMCRLRFPCGILSAYQMRRVADLAESYGGACADVTTRANLQIRDIRAEHATEVLTALQEAGILIQGSGADNIRNITGTPTAGIDPQELIDTRPLCRELNAYILHHRDLYGLPRKFNIAFDGGGTISALADTNDVGFAAVRVGANRAVPSGVYFRMELGGITGHGDFARDTGVLLESEECVPMAAAVARVFIEHGDRTDRKKARLKYLLDRWGIERYMAEVRKHLAFEPVRFPLDECEPRGPVVKHGHIGIRPQRQEGLFYAGVVLPAGRLQSDAMRGLAQIAERHGSATIRLTVWQNLLISDIPAERIPAVQQEIEALGLHWRANMVRGGLVACTGNGGCRFAASDTKRHALAIAAHLEARFGDPSVLDQPVNIHLTGCPNSCAQHYLGDLGFLGTKVEAGDELVEGYHVYAGGGYGEEQSLGREIARGVPAPEAPLVAERLLAAYLEHRQGPTESFRAFTQRHSTTQLQSMLEAR
jgi:ferredoxin-nitrite reductase